MPQLILEYSDNVLEKNDLFHLLKKINLFLAESLPAELSSCKSRAIKWDTYCIGDGSMDNAFVHINLKVMSGRDVEKLTNVGHGMIEILKKYFYQSAQHLKLQITIEIAELQTTYLKYFA